MKRFPPLAVALLALALNASAASQPSRPGAYPSDTGPRPSLGTKPARMTGRIKASLVDQEAKAKKQAATVEVAVRDIDLVDPDKTPGTPVAGQGHLHYILDGGPVIATTSPKLSFHGLRPGKHLVTVMLADNSHNPIGLGESLTFTIP